MPRKDNNELKILFSKNNKEEIKKEKIGEADKGSLTAKILIKPINSGYRILTKDKYIEWCLSKKKNGFTKSRIKFFKENWDKARKGYNFVILCGDTILSVDYFNKHILGGGKSEEVL